MATYDETQDLKTHALMVNVLQRFIGQKTTCDFCAFRGDGNLIIRNDMVLDDNKTTYHFVVNALFGCVMYAHTGDDEPVKYTTHYPYEDQFSALFCDLINAMKTETMELWFGYIFRTKVPRFFTNDNKEMVRCDYNDKNYLSLTHHLNDDTYWLSTTKMCRQFELKRWHAFRFYESVVNEVHTQREDATKHAYNVEWFLLKNHTWTSIDNE